MNPNLSNFVGILLMSFMSSIWANEMCRPDVYRCPSDQMPFKYNKRSDCIQEGKGSLKWESAKSSCVCINVEKVCNIAPQYAGLKLSQRIEEAELAQSNLQAEESTATKIMGPALDSNDTSAPILPTIEIPNEIAAVPSFGISVDLDLNICKLQSSKKPLSCDTHKDCKPVPAGISLCCNKKCLQVHNVPCVRDFFMKEDQLCTDSQHIDIHLEVRV